MKNTKASLQECTTLTEALAYVNSEMRGFTMTQKRDFMLNWELAHKAGPAGAAAKKIRRDELVRKLTLKLRPEKRAALEAELATHALL